MTGAARLQGARRPAAHAAGPGRLRPSPLSPAETGGKRLDIEGLRAVAIVSVVVYHSTWDFLPGGFVGVDVFFILSGFLITGQLWREVAQTGRLSLPRFWSRRAKRLLPATMVVLLACAAITVTTLAVTERAVFGWDIVAAAAYVVNWRLAWRSVDYAAQGTSLSPVQHFWSLAVEEQFYVVWPVLIVLVMALVGALSRRPAAHRRRALAVAVSVVVAASLAYSVRFTGVSQSEAFFATTTRLWELGLGALAALSVPLAAKLPRLARDGLAVAGAVGVVLACSVARENHAWPGYLALLPALGTVALVLAGTYPPMADSVAPARGTHAVPGARFRRHVLAGLLGARPMVWVGGLSYSWYLWHWPALIWARRVWPEQGPVWFLGIGVAALIPAYVTHKLVENPLRFAPVFSRRPARALAMGLACMLVGGGTGLAVSQWNQMTRPAKPAVPDQAVPAPPSPALPSGVPTPPDELRDWDALLSRSSYPALAPDPLAVGEDLPVTYENDDACGSSYRDTQPSGCDFGDPDGTTLVAVAGDSYTRQWSSVLDELGRRHSIRFLGFFKPSCPLTAAIIDGLPGGGDPYEECAEWSQNVTDRLADLRPDAVVVSGWTRCALPDPTDPASGCDPEGMAAGTLKLWEKLRQAGVPVVVIARNPDTTPEDSLGYPSVPSCVAEHLDSLTQCNFQGDQSVAQWQAATVERFGDGASLVSFNDLICGPDGCPAVIDGIVVYREWTTHMTNTFLMGLIEVADQRLAPLFSPDAWTQGGSDQQRMWADP
ncbi:MAG: acyltransferase [Bifidobacteriaceae bacterium]|nr:acyltransferase [Bifidobacteriaceae bacterium]